MNNDLTFLGETTHVPLPEPEPPAQHPVSTSRDEVYGAISKLVSPTGEVDVDALGENNEDTDSLIITDGEIKLDGDDAFVSEVKRITGDTELSRQQRIDQLTALEETSRDLARPEQQARIAVMVADQISNEQFLNERAAEVVGDSILHANRMRSIIDRTKTNLDKQFEETGKLDYVERGIEFIASEILPTGWIKSGHLDPVNLLNTIVPEVETGILDNFVLGDKLGEARKVFARLPPDEQFRRATLMEREINRIQGTFGTDNQFEADRLHQIMAGIMGDFQEADGARTVTTLEQLVNIGTAGLGGAAIKAGKGIFKGTKGVVKGSPAKVVAEAAPVAADPIIRAAAGDVTGKTAKDLGTSRPELIEDYQLFNDKGDAVLRGPDLVNEDPQVTEAIEELSRIRSQHNLVSDDEIAAATENLNNKISSVDHVEISKSSIYRDEVDNTLRAEYIIRPDAAPEFATAREAADYVTNKLEPYQLDKATVMKYDAAAEQYLPVDSLAATDLDEIGGYVVKADYRQTLNNVALPENILRKDKPTWLDDNLDTTTTFNQRAAAAITNIELAEGQARTVFSKLVQPYKAAGRKDQLRANEILTQGNEAGVDYSDADLINKFGANTAQIEAYKSVRRVYDTNHAIRNIQIRDHMQSRGFQEIQVSKDQKGYVIRTPDADRPTSAFDPKTGKTVKVNDGDEVYSTFSPIKYTDDAGDVAAASHVISRPQDLSPLGARVLPKLPGYIGTHLDAKWVVKHKVKGSNGNTVTTIKKFGTNPTDLRKYIEGHKEGKDMDVFFTRESETGEFSIEGEAELFADLEVMGHTKHRSDLFKLDESYKRNLLDPDVAVAKDIESMSRQAGLQETTKYFINKFNKTYGDLVPQGQMPWGKLVQPPNLNSEDLARFAQAKRLHKRIQIISGMDEDTIAKKFRNSLLHTANSFSKMAVDIRKADPESRVAKVQSQLAAGVSRSADLLNDFDVVAKMKNLNYLQFIVFHPVRQLALQAATSTLYIGVEGGTKYAASGRWLTDSTFLSAAKASGVNGKLFDSTVSKYAKVTGQTTAEARKFFDDFNESGLLESITSHQYQEYASRNVIGLRADFSGPKQGINSIARGLGGIKRASEKGFQTGEAANLVSAYTVVRNREIQRLGRSTLSKDEAKAVAIEAKQLAGNMGTSNKAAFQQGLLGVPFQFMSHNVKMLQIMMPHTNWTKGLAMPVLNNREKLRIGAAYSLMWGSGGLGVSKMVSDHTAEQGITLDPLVEDVLEEGLVGMGIERSFEALAGDDGNFEVSASFGALSGVATEINPFNLGDSESSTPVGFVAEFMLDALFGPTPDLTDLMGASGRLIDNHGAINRAVQLWQSPAFTTGEKFNVQAQYLFEFFPILDEAYQARGAHRTGAWVNGQGDPVMEANFAEVLAKGVLGIEPEKAAVYDLQSKYNARFALDNKPEGNEIRRAAKSHAQVVLSATQALNGGRYDKDEFFERMLTYQAFAKQAYPDKAQHNTFMAHLRKELDRQYKAQGTTIEREVIGNLMTDKFLQAETSYNTMLKDLHALPPSDHRDYAIQNIGSWFGAGKTENQSLDAR